MDKIGVFSVMLLFLLPMTSASLILGNRDPTIPFVSLGSSTTNNSIAFHVNLAPNPNQTMPSGTTNKINFSSAEFDTVGGFNLTKGYNYTIQAQGYYIFGCQYSYNSLSAANTISEITLYKNGNEYKKNILRGTTAVGGMIVVALDYSNTNDQYDCREYHSVGGTTALNSSNVSTYFYGSLITATTGFSTITINSTSTTNSTCTFPTCINLTYAESVYMHRNGTNAFDNVTMPSNLTINGVVFGMHSNTIDNIIQNWLRLNANINGTGNLTLSGTSATIGGIEFCRQNGVDCPQMNSSSGNVSVADRMYRNGTNSLDEVDFSNTTRLDVGTGKAFYYLFNSTSGENEFNSADDGSGYFLHINANQQQSSTIISGLTTTYLFCVDASEDTVNVNYGDRCLHGFIPVPTPSDGFVVRLNGSTRIGDPDTNANLSIFGNFTVSGSAKRNGLNLCDEAGNFCPNISSGGGGGDNITSAYLNKTFMYINGTNANKIVFFNNTLNFSVQGNITGQTGFFDGLGTALLRIAIGFFSHIDTTGLNTTNLNATNANLTNLNFNNANGTSINSTNIITQNITITNKANGIPREICSGSSSTSLTVFMNIEGATTSSANGWYPMRNGSITGISVSDRVVTIAGNQGNVTYEVRINNTKVLGFSSSFSATATILGRNYTNRNYYNFTDANIVQTFFNTTQGSPVLTSNNIIICFEVVYND